MSCQTFAYFFGKIDKSGFIPLVHWLIFSKNLPMENIVMVHNGC